MRLDDLLELRPGNVPQGMFGVTENCILRIYCIIRDRVYRVKNDQLSEFRVFVRGMYLEGQNQFVHVHQVLPDDKSARLPRELNVVRIVC